MKLTFLPLYLGISLVPVIFVACAWWSNQQRAESRRTQQSKARELTATSRNEKNKLLCRSRCAGGALFLTRGARTLKGATNVRLVGDNTTEYEDIEMHSLSADSGKKTMARSPIVVCTEIAMLTKPPLTRTRTRPRNTQADNWTSDENHLATNMRPSTRTRNNYPYGRSVASSTISSPSRPWWERPDDGDSNGKQQSDPVPFFRLDNYHRGR